MLNLYYEFTKRNSLINVTTKQWSTLNVYHIKFICKNNLSVE